MTAARQKLRSFLSFFLLGTIITLCTLWLFHRQDIEARRCDIAMHPTNTVNMQKAKLGNEFNLIAADLLFFSRYHQTLDMLEDPEMHTAELIKDLTLFSRGSKVYDQVRVIDTTGMEIIRINWAKDEPVVVTKEQLQFKGERYYFKDTIKLKKDDVFVSPFDLNIEHGVIEQPLKPMIRFGTPIFDRQGEKRGIIIFNYLGENLIQKFKDVVLDSPGHYMLVNADGYWIIGKDKEDEWGFMYEDRKQRSFGSVYPMAWEKISTSESGHFYNPQGVFTFTTIYPLIESWKSSTGSGKPFESSARIKDAKEQHWKAISFIPGSVLAKEVEELRKKYIGIATVMIMVLAIGSWFLALANTKRKLAEESLRQANDTLEKKVWERTIELSRTNEKLSNEICEHKKTMEKTLSLAKFPSENPNPVLRISADGTVLYSNKAGDTLMTCPSGYCTPELWQRYMDDVLASGHPKHIEIECDGQVFALTFSPVVDAGYVNIYALDITERKNAEQQREKALYDIGERIKELSCMYAVAESIRKRSTVDEIFKDVIRLIPPGWQYPEITRGKIIFDGREYVSEPFEETRWKQSSDIIVNGETRGSIEVCYLEECPTLDEGPFVTDERNLINGIARNISEAIERKQAEAEREKLLRVLKLKNEELQSIVYISSHDLKTPLVNIGGFSSMLTQHCEQLEELVERADICDDIRKEIISLIEENIPEDLNYICSGSERMNKLINGLLRVSRIGTSEIKYEKIDMNKMITEITNTMKYQTDEAGATITIGQLPDCSGDLNQTNQAFSNLIDNALKYLDPEREGIIRITGQVTGNKSVYCVEDNGIGIDQAYEGKVFEIYHRLEPDGLVAGEGLGLTIVRRVLDRNDGEIWMKSELGKGSKFFVSLPTVKA